MSVFMVYLCTGVTASLCSYAAKMVELCWASSENSQCAEFCDFAKLKLWVGAGANRWNISTVQKGHLSRSTGMMLQSRAFSGGSVVRCCNKVWTINTTHIIRLYHGLNGNCESAVLWCGCFLLSNKKLLVFGPFLWLFVVLGNCAMDQMFPLSHQMT